MTAGRDPSKLVERAEALIAGAELREPDFEALAQRIEGALATAGKSDDSLLLPPLPESVEDERLPVGDAPTQPARDTMPETGAHSPPLPKEGASLAELARATVARREAKDAVSLAKESLAIATQQRTPAVPTIEVAEVKERERRTIPPARRGRPAFDTRGPWLGVAVAAVGLAAGFGLYIAGRNQAPSSIQVPVAETAAPAKAVPATLAKGPVERAPAAPEVTPDMLPKERRAPSEDAPVLTPEALAREGGKAKGAPGGAEAHAALPVERPAGASSTVATMGAAKAEKVVLEEERSTGGPSPAGAAKPGTTPGLKPAEMNANGGIADRPSSGAAQAAVGAVLGAARSCIAGQAQGSSATLVFGSSGEVTNVSVGGPAVGTPAAGCIQSALKKARVQPFAAPSFSLGVTIRPP